MTTTSLAEGYSPDVLKVVVTELTGTWTLLLVLLPVLSLMRTHPVEGPRWPARLLLHAGLSVAVGVTHTLLMWGVRSALFPILGWGRYDYGEMRYRFAMEYQKQLAAYVLVYGLVTFVAWVRRGRETQLRASELARQLSEARLAALKRQLEPHFLFNALNTVSAFVREDPARAEAMIGHLSDFLRETLRHADAAEVPLGKELDFLRSWVEIMKARFEDRLDVAIDVPPGTLGVLVPHLVLQPLVENSVRHGAGLGTLRVRVSAARSGSRLRLSVSDSGPGLPGSPEEALAAGTGLSNTAERLRALHGDDQALTFSSDPAGGLVVTVEVPWREAS
jgi:sensor histidine kinase YesM